MRIAICEDNKAHAEILKAMVLRWAEKEGLKVDIGYYRSAEEFLFHWREDAHYDLAFLDIQLERMSGMQLASYIRNQDRTMILVFTTGVKEYILRGYEVAAFRYLIKPLKEREVALTLKRASLELENVNKDAIVVTLGGVSRRILKNDIYYVEIDNHYLTIHTMTEKLRYKEKLANLEPLLLEPQFCKCHRSYIVNLHHVSQFTRDDIEIDNGDHLPVSKARWSNLNRCYICYYTQR